MSDSKEIGKMIKEVNKTKGEILSDLDSAKTKALDNLIKNLFN